MIKIVAFDVFNTLVDFKDVPYEERKAYADQLKTENDNIQLPSSWANLKMFDDVPAGLQALRDMDIEVFTFSNCPVPLQKQILENNGITNLVDYLFPLAHYKTCKPHAKAYTSLAGIVEDRQEILVVSANPKFGDIEKAKEAGMRSILIRNGYPNNVIELAASLNDK